MSFFKAVPLLTLCLCQAGMVLAEDTHGNQQGIYLGAFGGLGKLDSTSLRQTGAVILPAPLPQLPIDADGSTDSPSASLGGVQLGYQWSGWQHSARSGWGLNLAVEFEGLYLGEHSPEGEMPIQPRILGTQYVSFDAKGYALLAGVVLAVETPWSQRFVPYAGVSAGTARISLSDADSANPSEPGINHFNSDPDASDRASALQFKLGVESKLTDQLFLFTEYRYLKVDATRYRFGATVYPGEHLPTEPWDVRLGDLEYNLFVAGLKYQF